MTLPARTVEADRSFSCMERVKTWLRSAMASDHLPELCVLHCYQERVDEKRPIEYEQQWLVKSDDEWTSERNFVN